ncbi:lipase secretion chaperone [Pseudomonas cavernae]|nr:lipase secretion chaperone [Pseudomonas cavernae]
MSRHLGLLGGALALASTAMGLTLYLSWPSAAPVPLAAPAPGVAVSTSQPAYPVAVAAAAVGPQSSGPVVSRPRAQTGVLKTDAAGNLRVDLELRDYFDRFLGSADEVGLDQAVARLITDANGRLQEPALGQMSRLLGDYLDFKRASLELPPPLPQPDSDPEAQLQAIRDDAERWATLRREHMTPAAVAAFFGREEALSRYTLDSLALAQRSDLSASARTEAEAALRARLPAAERASADRQAQALAEQEESEQLLREGASEAQMRSTLSQTHDAVTVERLLAELQTEQAWRQRYEAYRQGLASLLGSGMSDSDVQAETQRLRERLFTSADLFRVQANDALAARKEAAAKAGL